MPDLDGEIEIKGPGTDELTVRRSYGGGIDNFGGTLNVAGNTISDNSGIFGGVIYNNGAGRRTQSLPTIRRTRSVRIPLYFPASSRRSRRVLPTFSRWRPALSEVARRSRLPSRVTSLNETSRRYSVPFSSTANT